MLVDHFMDLTDDTGHLWLRAWRCLNCGEVVEPGIVSRRQVRRSRLKRLVERLEGKSPRRGEVVPLGV
jgi:hypothetical protein